MKNKDLIQAIVATSDLSLKKLGLRFDRVALRLLDDLQVCSTRLVPKGKTLLVTVTAPICVPSKTATALEKKIEKIFHQQNTSKLVKMSIQKNQVQVKIVKNVQTKNLKFIGFIHNPTTKPKQLFDLTEKWLTSSL
jgi:hypothetical protein